MNIFKSMIRQKKTIVWLSVGIPIIAIFLVATILFSTTFYNLACVMLGGSIQKGRDNTRYYDVTAQSKQMAFDNGQKVNEKICEEGFVLLKNQNKSLPLTKAETKVSVFGKNSIELVYGGSGSGGGRNQNAIKLKTSLNNAGFEINPTLYGFYSNDSKSGEGRPSNPKIENAGVSINSGETPIGMYDDAIRNSYKNYNDAAIVVISRISGEGFDLPYTIKGDNTKHYLELDNNEKAMLNEVKQHFDKIVVLINSANVLELKELQDDDKIGAIIHIAGPGSSGINSLGKILNGTVNPSGKTVDTWASDFTKNPTWNNFADSQKANSTTYRNTDGSLSDYYFVDYEENVYVGYRYYETRGELEGADWYNNEVVYPFGHGLSYTNFSWEITNRSALNSVVISDSNKNADINIKVKVQNNGDVAGKDVVQLYCDLPYLAGGIEKSSTVLCGFAKTPIIQPNEEYEVAICFNPYYIASYDYNDKNGNEFKGFELDANNNYKLALKENSHSPKSGVENIVFSVAAGGIKYAKDNVTGSDVVNRYDDADDELDVIMSRTNFESTWPTQPDGRKFVDKNKFISKDSLNPNKYTEIPNMGKKSNLKAVELRDKDYNDPMWDQLLDSLTFADMKNLFNNGAFSTQGIKSIALPPTLASDGPVGFTNFMSDVDIYDTVSYACEVTISSTWNVDLVNELGESIGEEGAFGNQKSANYIPYTGWYAPGANIHRSPFGGRNFEYFSEDPFLSGMIAANEINGAKSKGLVTYIKHFALNEQETHRDENGVATWATEQAIREIYLRPFEMAVKIAEPRGLMSSFNRIGSVWCGGDYRLLTEILRNEWGFRGCVLSDFNVNVYMSTKQMAYAGGSLNLSTSRPWTKASESSASDVTVLRNSAHDIIYSLVNSNAMNGINKKTNFKVVMPYWQQAVIVIDCLLIATFIVCGVLIVIKTRKTNRKTKEKIQHTNKP